MTFIQRLRNKLGDFWWYSIMIFLACRSGDVIQAFIGLWLVPKYVGQQELGAVLPLQQLCGLFAVPLAALATVFTKYVNVYATRGEYGKVKSFIIDVLRASIVVFAVCIVAAYLILPHFYLRLNITSGLLTVLILASGFIGNIAQLFSSALQGLKKFKALTIFNLIGAPIRLVTLLVAMPIRALSGYILGQATPPASTALVAAWTLHRDLKAIPRDTSWRKDLPEIGRYFLPVLISLALGILFASISMTVFRQRLPEVESAAYYMLSRFAEIAGYVGMSMMVVLFPLAAEAHEKGKEATGALKKTIWGISLTTIALAIIFAFTSNWIFSLTETWRVYLPYAQFLPWMTLVIGAGTILGAVSTYEMACRRFGFISFLLIVNFIWIVILQIFTGYEFFRGTIPDALLNWIAGVRLATLKNLICAQVISAAIQLTAIPFFIRRTKTHH